MGDPWFLYAARRTGAVPSCKFLTFTSARYFWIDYIFLILIETVVLLIIISYRSVWFVWIWLSDLFYCLNLFSVNDITVNCRVIILWIKLYWKMLWKLIEQFSWNCFSMLVAVSDISESISVSISYLKSISSCLGAGFSLNSWYGVEKCGWKTRLKNAAGKCVFKICFFS